MTYSLGFVSSVQNQTKESECAAQWVVGDAHRERLKMQKAIEQTAANTSKTSLHLQKVERTKMHVLISQKIKLPKKAPCPCIAIGLYS